MAEEGEDGVAFVCAKGKYLENRGLSLVDISLPKKESLIAS